MAASLTGAVEKDDGCGYHNGDCPLVHVIVLVEQAATPMTVYVEWEKAKMVTLAESRWESSGSISRKEVEPSAEFVELARGIEPSNRRRVGSETCLTGSCEGGQPPRTLPTKGTHPLRNP
jgi:hypothetical protein